MTDNEKLQEETMKSLQESLKRKPKKTESKEVKNEAYYYYWEDDIEEVDPNNEANDDIWYAVAENMKETEPEDYGDWDVYDIMADIISIWKIEKRSRLYDYLLKWYGSEEELLKNVRDVYDTDRAIYFVTGCGYSIFDADLLGGNANGDKRREFDAFVNNGGKREEESKVEETKTIITEEFTKDTFNNKYKPLYNGSVEINGDSVYADNIIFKGSGINKRIEATLNGDFLRIDNENIGISYDGIDIKVNGQSWFTDDFNENVEFNKKITKAVKDLYNDMRKLQQPVEKEEPKTMPIHNEVDLDEVISMFREMVKDNPNNEKAKEFLRKYDKEFTEGKEVKNETKQKETIEKLEENDNLRKVATGLSDKKAEDVLNSVIGQMSDGIWENSPQMNKYWNFASINNENGELYIVVDDDFGSGFAKKSDEEVKKFFATKVKQIAKIFIEDNPETKASWDRNCTVECSYLDYHSGVTIQDAYRVYDKLLNRIDRIQTEDKKTEDVDKSKYPTPTGNIDEYKLENAIDNPVWIKGYVVVNNKVYDVSAKVFIESSHFGIDDGQVSKLWIQDREKGKPEVNYDRGWDVEPSEKFRDTYKAILKLVTDYRDANPYETDDEDEVAENKEVKTEDIDDNIVEELYNDFDLTDGLSDAINISYKQNTLEKTFEEWIASPYLNNYQQAMIDEFFDKLNEKYPNVESSDLENLYHIITEYFVEQENLTDNKKVKTESFWDNENFEYNLEEYPEYSEEAVKAKKKLREILETSGFKTSYFKDNYYKFDEPWLYAELNDINTSIDIIDVGDYLLAMSGNEAEECRLEDGDLVAYGYKFPDKFQLGYTEEQNQAGDVDRICTKISKSNWESEIEDFAHKLISDFKTAQEIKNSANELQ